MVLFWKCQCATRLGLRLPDSMRRTSEVRRKKEQSRADKLKHLQSLADPHAENRKKKERFAAKKRLESQRSRK